jgi:hypothetical protein
VLGTFRHLSVTMSIRAGEAYSTLPSTVLVTVTYLSDSSGPEQPLAHGCAWLPEFTAGALESVREASMGLTQRSTGPH